jgi:uncharacterized protein
VGEAAAHQAPRGRNRRLSVRGLLARVLLGPDRKLRMLWRAAIFGALSYWLLQLLEPLLFNTLGRRLQLSPGLTAASIALGELGVFLVALVCTGIFALYEGRRVDSYGLPVAGALSLRTAEGALAGALIAGVVAVGMYLLGGMQIHGFARSGTALALAALGWLGTNIVIGIAEESWFRGYLLQSLWKSIGFWPASIVIALLFAAIHYFFKTGENIWDVITLVSFSLLLCYSVAKTGTLWFAVGLHVAFDYLQLFVIGTPNGAQLPQGRLLDVSFEGPAWLTGGVLGTEASVLVYPMIALAWLYLEWRFPGRAPLAGAAAASAGPYS